MIGKEKSAPCPLGLIYEQLPAGVITFLLPVCHKTPGVKAHNSNAAVSDMTPVSGPISFDISPHAKNYSLQQNPPVQKNILSSCTGGEERR